MLIDDLFQWVTASDFLQLNKKEMTQGSICAFSITISHHFHSKLTCLNEE